MIFDVHVHVAEVHRHVQTDRFLGSGSNRHLRAMLRRLGLNTDLLYQADINDLVSQKLADWLFSSSVDRAVVLAMDGVYDADGSYNPRHTRWVADNDFVAGLAKRCASVLFGASVHPYRLDANAEIHRVIAEGACLMKWIPSAQRIRLDDPRCIPFYEVLAHFGLPLLVHTGIEHVSSRSLNELNAPRLLRHPLKRGVTVIAAHCGARMFLHERSMFKSFCRMALEYENCYGDLAAFGIPTRLAPLRALQSSDALMAKIVYGSDFPAYPMPGWFALSLGWRATREVLVEANPFERPYRLLRALGVSDEVFGRAGKLLRLRPQLSETQ